MGEVFCKLNPRHHHPFLFCHAHTPLPPAVGLRAVCELNVLRAAVDGCWMGSKEVGTAPQCPRGPVQGGSGNPQLKHCRMCGGSRHGPAASKCLIYSTRELGCFTVSWKKNVLLCVMRPDASGPVDDAESLQEGGTGQGEPTAPTAPGAERHTCTEMRKFQPADTSLPAPAL